MAFEIIDLNWTKARGKVGKQPHMIALAISPTLVENATVSAVGRCGTVEETVLTSRARIQLDTMFHLTPFPIEGNKLIVGYSRGRHYRQ